MYALHAHIGRGIWLTKAFSAQQGSLSIPLGGSQHRGDRYGGHVEFPAITRGNALDSLAWSADQYSSQPFGSDTQAAVER